MPSTSVKNGLYWSPRSGTYHFEYRKFGKKHNGDTGCDQIGPAREYLIALKARAVHERAGMPPRVDVPTLAKALEMWADAESGSVTEKHLLSRIACINKHCGPVLKLPLNQLDTAKMDALRATFLGGEWRGEGWASPAKKRTAGGWNIVRRHVYAIVNWCIDRGLLKERPFKSKPLKVQEKLRPTLWPEQSGQFMAAVANTTKSKDIPTAIRLMLQLGLRENEALGAVWEGFDERQGVYRPPQAKNRELREIALPPDLMEYLRAAHGEGRHGLIMPGGADGTHGQSYTKKVISKAGEKLGLVGLHPHALRATFATAHWEAGTTLNQLTAMLGHKDPNTTMGYIRQRPLSAAVAQAKVAAAMNLVSSPPLVPAGKADAQKRAKK